MAPRRQDDVEILSPAQLVQELRTPAGRDLRRKYKGQPLKLAKDLHLRLPKKPVQVMQERGVYDEAKHGPIVPGLRELIYEVCTLQEESAAVVGPRGGGKSMGVAFIEFYLWIIEEFDALNLGGSELQADQVYQYLLAFLDSHGYWRQLLKDEPMISKSETKEGAWIRVLTASPKSVRSPHAGGLTPGGADRGGLLVIDEEAEADAKIVKAALPTINTARPSVNVRSSTFHNVEGTFAELIDNHVEMGYKLYQWDIFDICEKCDCVGECQSEEPCFREDHTEEYLNPETGQLEEKLVHKAYCNGRAMYSDGWIPTREIVKLWKRFKRNHSVFEVEAMGSRPSSSGHVIKNLTKYAQSIVPTPARMLYVPGAYISICVDWGTVAAAITVWQELVGNRHILLHADLLEQAGQEEIYGAIFSYYNQYGNEVTEIAADIGGGGNYLNKDLREVHRLPVRDVNFAEEKESAAAAMNIISEAGGLILPAEHEGFHQQIRNWRRVNSRIVKGNDHLCDSAICYFSKFIDRLGVTHMRVRPRTFSSAPPSRSGTVQQTSNRVMPVAVARTLRRR